MLVHTPELDLVLNRFYNQKHNMDFLKILRSLEEFLYEAITWLFFYPRTFWHILIRPLEMIVYSSGEITNKKDNPFNDSISPPLFLILTLGLLHLIEVSLHSQLPVSKNSVGNMIFGNTQDLIIYRAIAYCIWPLVFATGYLKHSHAVISRETLRDPFFAQCFMVTPFALGLGIGSQLTLQHAPLLNIIGISCQLLSLGWYLVTQMRWLKFSFQHSYAKAFRLTAGYFMIGSVINVSAGYLLLLN